MQTILLTGATGYLGGYLSKNFLDKGYFVIALALNEKESFKYANIKNSKVYYLYKTSISEIFEKENIDIVIHTATIYGRRNEDITSMLKANIQFPLEVLQNAIKHNTKLFINTSTILAKNISAYSLTKSQFADWLEFYSDKIKCINLKLDHFYGPNDNSVKFIAWIMEQLKNEVESIDLTEGSQTRDFIYIDDVVSAFDIVVSNSDKISSGKLNNFEVGTNNKTSIRDMVLTIKKELGNNVTKLNFGAIPFRKNEVLDYQVDTTGLHLLGWKPEYLFVEKGIQRIIEIERGEL